MDPPGVGGRAGPVEPAARGFGPAAAAGVGCGIDVGALSDDERREAAARRLWDELAVTTEHRDVTRVQAFREMCEATVRVYDGTPDQHYADWAREALRLLDERERGGESR